MRTIELEPDEGEERRRWAQMLLFPALIVAVVVALFLLSSSDGDDEPRLTFSEVQGAPVDQLVWSEPRTLTGIASIEQFDATGGVAYAVVDGWIATSTDLVTWTHLPTPPGLEPTDPDQLVVIGDRPTRPKLAGQVVDFDASRGFIVALITTEVFPVDEPCPPPPPAPAARLVVSVDGGTTWTQIERNDLGDDERDLRVRVEGSVATNGVTAVAWTTADWYVLFDCGVDSALTDLPEAVDSFVVISPDLVARHAGGCRRPGRRFNQAALSRLSTS